jgi:hypothetical protein
MAFQFKLEHNDGTPANPALLKTAVPNWQAGDTIPLPRGTLRVRDASRARGSRRRRGPTAGTGRCGRGLKSV